MKVDISRWEKLRKAHLKTKTLSVPSVVSFKVRVNPKRPLNNMPDGSQKSGDRIKMRLLGMLLAINQKVDQSNQRNDCPEY